MESIHSASPPYFDTTNGSGMKPERQSNPAAITASDNPVYSTRFPVVDGWWA